MTSLKTYCTEIQEKEDFNIYTFPVSEQCFRDLINKLRSIKDIEISDYFHVKHGMYGVNIKVYHKDKEEFNKIVEKELAFIEVLVKLVEGINN